MTNPAKIKFAVGNMAFAALRYTNTHTNPRVFGYPNPAFVFSRAVQGHNGRHSRGINSRETRTAGLLSRSSLAGGVVANRAECAVDPHCHMARAALAGINVFVAIGAIKIKHSRREHFLVNIMFRSVVFVDIQHGPVAGDALGGIALDDAVVALAVFIGQIAGFGVDHFGGRMQTF